MDFINSRRKYLFSKRHFFQNLQTVRGSSIVEMSYIMPLILLLFMLVIFTVFYYHDKIILNATAAETAILGTQTARRRGTNQYNLEGFFQERIDHKLICMTHPSLSITQTDKKITIDVTAQKGRMKLHVVQQALIVKPEDYMRWKK